MILSNLMSYPVLIGSVVFLIYSLGILIIAVALSIICDTWKRWMR